MTEGPAPAIRSNATQPRVPRVARSRRAELVDRPTQRRAGVWRRAIRREVSRIRDRRLAAVIVVGIVTGVLAAGLIARGEAAGADARSYWVGARIWLDGGDPFAWRGWIMPYVYTVWFLPILVPWALLPWDVAWFVWRSGMVLLLFWTFSWAYRRRPGATAIAFVLLALPIAANIDTGNILLVLTYLVWAAQFVGPRAAGALLALATWVKWLPILLVPVLAPKARAWSLVWIGVAVVLSLLTLPLTLAQLDSIFGFGPRPIRIDYLVILWASVPWLWRHDLALQGAHPKHWWRYVHLARLHTSHFLQQWRTNPKAESTRSLQVLDIRLRAFFGLNVET